MTVDDDLPEVGAFERVIGSDELHIIQGRRHDRACGCWRCILVFDREVRDWLTSLKMEAA